MFASVSWRARPKLAITRRRASYPRLVAAQTCYGAAISRSIRITEFRRIARKVRLLEIDTTDDRLLVFTRWDLGTDPLDVLDALTAAGYAGSSLSGLQAVRRR